MNKTRTLGLLAGIAVGLLAAYYLPLWLVIAIILIGSGFPAATWMENEHKKKVSYAKMLCSAAPMSQEADEFMATIEPQIHPLLYTLLGFTGWGLVLYLGYKMAESFVVADRAIHEEGIEDRRQIFELQPIHFDGARGQRLGNEPGMNTIILSSHAPFEAMVAFRVIVPKLVRPLFQWAFGQFGAFHYYGYVKSSSPEERGNGEPRHTAYVNTWFGEGACRFEFLTSSPDVRVERGVRLMQLRDTDGNYPPHGYQEHAGIYA